jgi:hypothetical protein
MVTSHKRKDPDPNANICSGNVIHELKICIDNKGVPLYGRGSKKKLIQFYFIFTQFTHIPWCDIFYMISTGEMKISGNPN